MMNELHQSEAPAQKQPQGKRSYQYIDLITAAFVAVLIISNITSTKILLLGPFTFDGGTILFPLAYIFGDVLTEVYGYKRSRRVIWTGFFWLFVAALVFAIVGALPAASDWKFQNSYNDILGQIPRIVLGSLVAYFAGEFSNSFVLAKMKIWTNGRWLWMRTIGSTIVGEAVDTVLFVIIAFAGDKSNDLLLSIFVSNYIFKCSVEALFTPITYQVVNFLKRAEHEDYYDRDTDFNPFQINEI
ncbi:MAG: queuosine precursor transporter [Chloroflexota bacterium]